MYIAFRAVSTHTEGRKTKPMLQPTNTARTNKSWRQEWDLTGCRGVDKYNVQQNQSNYRLLSTLNWNVSWKWKKRPTAKQNESELFWTVFSGIFKSKPKVIASGQSQRAKISYQPIRARTVGTWGNWWNQFLIGSWFCTWLAEKKICLFWLIEKLSSNSKTFM